MSVITGAELQCTPNKKLREANQKAIKRAVWENKEMKDLRESFKTRFGVDPFDLEKFPVMKEGFSWNKVRTKLAMREADVSSAFPQFLRAGVQTITNAMYEATPTTYEDWVKVVPSSKDTELYAPNHGVAFPRQLGYNELYPEVGVAALDIQLKNYKYGSMYVVQKELLDDDQTGSFQRQAGYLGEYMKLVSEVLVMGKLASVANMQYIDFKIPTSETKPSTESTYPWSTALVGGGKNRPSSFGAISQSTIQDALVGLMNQKNLQGIKMLVQPTRLLIGPQAQFDSSVLMHSAYYPSGAAAAGNVGGAFAINPIKGLLDITVSRFMFKNDGTVDGTSKAWYVLDDTKPWFILQMREPVSVEQENPASGSSFNLDQYRYKAKTRMNADHIDPRFAWQGNDGSV